MNLFSRTAVFCFIALVPMIQSRAQVAFGGELFHFATASTNTPPGKCTLDANVPVGATIVVIGAEDGNDYHIADVTDSKGNSYKQELYYHNTDYQQTEQSIWSAATTSPLTTSDTISITWTPPAKEFRSYAVSIVYLTGVINSQPDGTAKNNAYMSSDAVHVPGKVLTPNSIVVGMLAGNNFEWKIGPGWTIYRSEPVNIQYHFFYKILKVAGNTDPGGTGSGASTYSGVWAAFASAGVSDRHP